MWSGFDNFYFLFTHHDARAQFDDPYDAEVIHAVFRPPGESGGAEPRVLYNRRNRFFEAVYLTDSLGGVLDEGAKAVLVEKIKSIRDEYEGLVDEQRRKNRQGFALQ